MKLFEQPFFKKEETEQENINNIFEEKPKASTLGLQLSSLVRNDEEYAKFNEYMK